MLTIRAEQMQAFQTARQDALPGGILAFLVKEAPAAAAAVGRAGLPVLVDSALADAAELGLSIEWDLYRFCWLELLHGPRFHENKVWAKLIIAEPALTPTHRIDRLEQYHLDYPALALPPSADSDASDKPLNFSV